MFKLNILFSSIFTLLFLSGCGEMREGKRGRGVASVGQSLTKSSPISGDESSVAYAVCNALRVKDSKYRVDHLNQGFYWQLEHRSCQNQKTSTEINSILKAANSSSPLYYDSSFGGFYFKDVETHNQGLFKEICDAVLKGQSPSNSITKGGETYQYSFYVEEGKVKAKVLMGKQDINENSPTHEQWLTQSEDVLVINTSNQSSSSMTGLVESRQQTILCPGGDGNETITQTFLYHSGYTN